MISFCRQFRDNDVNLPCMVYLNHNLYTYYSYGSSKFTKGVGMNMYRFPKSVHDELVSSNLGIFPKFEALVGRELNKRYC